MKAVVVELNKGKAAVLSDDGCVATIKNNNYEIGQVIQMSSPKIGLNKKISVIAASAAAFVLLGIGGWAYASPYTYVSVDVNPSIEFMVNRFDRVLSVKAVNDDGEELLNNISLEDLKNKTIYDAIAKSVAQISDSGYFDGDIEGGIVITTSSESADKAEELANELAQTVEEEIAKSGDEVIVEATSVGLERVEEAKKLGVTPGKLNLVEKLQVVASDPSLINTEEWLNKPVKEIMKATKDFKKASKATTKETDIEVDEENDEETLNIEVDEQLIEKEKEESEKASEKAKAIRAEEKATKMLTKEEKDKAEDVTELTKEDAKADNNAGELVKEEANATKDVADKAQENADKANKEADKAIKEDDKAIKEADKEDDKAIKEADKEADKAIKEADKTDNKTNESSKDNQSSDVITDNPKPDNVEDNQDVDNESNNKGKNENKNENTNANKNSNNGNSNSQGNKNK